MATVPAPTPNQDAWTIIQGLDGMDSEMLAHPGVAHIPSILEDGELPEAITFASGKAMVLVATDQRVVTVQITYDIIKRQHSVRKVTSHQYRDMTSFDAQHGFMAAGFVMVDENGKRKIIAARKLGRDGFASVVNAHLMPAAPTPARKRADLFSGMPFWQKIISVPLSIAVLVAAVGAVWFVGETAWGWWQSASVPKHFTCNLDAERAIKGQMNYPSTFDDHLLATSDWNSARATVQGDKENGWTINAAMIFGAKNAFGMQTDHIVRYQGYVNSDGECTGVLLGEFAHYRQ